MQMGATVEEKLSKKVTHVLAMDLEPLLQQVSAQHLARFKGVSFYSLSPLILIVMQLFHNC